MQLAPTGPEPNGGERFTVPFLGPPPLLLWLPGPRGRPQSHLVQHGEGPSRKAYFKILLPTADRYKSVLKLIIFKDSQRHYFLLAFWGSSSVFAGTEDFFQTLVRADYYMVRRAKSREVWLSKPHGQCIMDPADLECNFQNGTVELWVDFQIVSVKWNWNFWQGFLPGTLIDQEMRYNISWV